MNAKKHCIFMVLIFFSVMLSPGSYALGPHDASSMGNLYSQAGGFQGTDNGAQEIGETRNADENGDERGEILRKKNQEMEKEYLDLLDEQHQLNMEIEDFNQGDRGRSAKTKRQERLFEERRLKLKEKMQDYMKRQEALDAEMDEYEKTKK